MSEATQEQAASEEPGAAPRLKDKLETEVVHQLLEQMHAKSRLGVPRLEKIVLNMGIGRGKGDKKILEEAQTVLRTVSGQRPVVTRARKSVAGFQLREGQPVGCKVTIRQRRMYEFLDRLISVVLPRIRDFHGLEPNSFDGHGNYTLGIREHIVFPEMDPDAVDNIYGMDITICTTAHSDAEGLALLKLMGMPFRV